MRQSTYLPSIMLLGRPVSQDFGEFQGRADISSSLVLAQPPRQRALNARTSRKTRRITAN
jgi:hypothetical protein